ncbi:hypothetical protein C8R44DRAFT_885622 [Mycena epipterygia]|nr:hypothetical protein C8R44DRAFT_885622 [Mycena epipterygia]
MPSRTKSPLSTSTTNSTPTGDSPGTPRRSARFAVSPAPVASTSRIAPRTSRRLSAPALTPTPTPPPTSSTSSKTAPAPTKKRKSPDLHEEGIRKRLRVRCPAEQPTPTRKGKGKAASPPNGNSTDGNGKTPTKTLRVRQVARGGVRVFHFRPFVFLPFSFSFFITSPASLLRLLPFFHLPPPHPPLPIPFSRLCHLSIRFILSSSTALRLVLPRLLPSFPLSCRLHSLPFPSPLSPLRLLFPPPLRPDPPSPSLPNPAPLISPHTPSLLIVLALALSVPFISFSLFLPSSSYLFLSPALPRPRFCIPYSAYYVTSLAILSYIPSASPLSSLFLLLSSRPIRVLLPSPLRLALPLPFLSSARPVLFSPHPRPSPFLSYSSLFLIPRPFLLISVLRPSTSPPFFPPSPRTPPLKTRAAAAALHHARARASSASSASTPNSPSQNNATSNPNNSTQNAQNAQNNKNTNPLTLRGTNPAVRGASPAPGRLDEIDMGVVQGGSSSSQHQSSSSQGSSQGQGQGSQGHPQSPMSSPLSSPVRERGEPPWGRVNVKREEVEVGLGLQSSASPSQSQREAEEEGMDGDEPKDGEREGKDAGQGHGDGDVEMEDGGASASNTSASTPANASTSTNSSTPSTPAPRALSPDDLAPSPFAPPVLAPIIIPGVPKIAHSLDSVPQRILNEQEQRDITLPMLYPTTPAPGSGFLHGQDASSPTSSLLSPLSPTSGLGSPNHLNGPNHSLLAPHTQNHDPVDLGFLAVADASLARGVAPGPPVSPDWPLPHAPFPLSSSSTSNATSNSSSAPNANSPSSPSGAGTSSPFVGAPGAGASWSTSGGAYAGGAYSASPHAQSAGGLGYAPPPSFGTPPSYAGPYATPSPGPYATPTSSPYATPPSTPTPGSPYGYPASPAERQTRAVEWGALLERRRKAGERALAEAREREAREREREAMRGRVGWWGVRAGGSVSPIRSPTASLSTEQEGAQSPSPNLGEQEGARLPSEEREQGCAGRQGTPEEMAVDRTEVETEQHQERMERDREQGQGRTDVHGKDGREEMLVEEFEGRRRSPLWVVAAAAEEGDDDAQHDAHDAHQHQNESRQQQPHDDQQQQDEQQQQQPTDLVYEAPQMLSAYPPQPEDDLGPDPHSRLNAAWGPWKIACRVRVWDVRTRYTPALIRSLVAQEADDYFSARGLPHPDALLFMDEEYYDWELEESASEGDGEGSAEDEGGESSFELEQPAHQAFVADNITAESTDANADMDLGTGMGGVLSSFYVAPPPPSPQPLHHPHHFAPQGQHQHQHQQQLPLPLPPPPLASVRVPVLRHLFTDIAIAPAAGAARGRGTPVDPGRRAAWGGPGAEEGESPVGAGRGTLERRLPHPRARPHPMYLAMARAVESGAYEGGGGGGGGGGSAGQGESGVATEDLPPLPRLREEGEPAMLPMRGLRDLVRSLRGGTEEDEGTEEERRERERREMSEAFEPDEAVWQEFLKSVGVEGAPAAGVGAGGAAQDGDAMDVDAAREEMGGDADADADPDPESDDGGGGGGTSGGVALGLPPANSASSSLNNSSHSSPNTSGSILGAGVGMGVEMGIGMFGMAMGAMGMGWFGGPANPPVAVAVGDGERERDRESSLSFALGV